MAQLTLRRIQMELTDLERDPPPGCSASPVHENDLRHWMGIIAGPENSPYAGGIFYVAIEFSPYHPFVPPQVNFITKIYHPNINANGNVCLNVLQKNWNMALTIGKLLLSIQALLNEPNPDDPLVMESALLYRFNRDKFNQIARDWTCRYAM